jgi:DNA-binding NarL/FixJ family response regulator
MEEGKGTAGDAIRSALERLPVAVIAVEGGRVLRPMNRRGEEFFAAEHLVWDLMKSRPAHPLSAFIRNVLEDGPESVRIVRFPGGNHYRIEASRRSEKGPQRMLMVLIDAAEAPVSADALFEQWQLTPRERAVARALMRGVSSEAICAENGFAESTLKTHVRSLLAKSDSRNRAEFLSKLLREG